LTFFFTKINTETLALTLHSRRRWS